jgi:hypothetical protein
MTKIALQLRNDLALPTSLNVLGGTQDNSNQNNADTLYEWDLSTENFLNVDTVIIQSRLLGQTLFRNTASFIGNLSIAGVVNVLTSLNQGNFLSVGNVIYTYNNEIEFGDLVLTLQGVPSTQSITEGAWVYFVKPNTALQTFVYPTDLSFTSEWFGAFELLISQTNAAIGITGFGLGCVMPLFVQPYANSGSVTFTVSSPKAADLQPILSTSAGVTQGYTLNWSPGEGNAMLFFPSGNCSEVTAMTIDNLAGRIFFYNGDDIFPNLASWNLTNHRARVTTDGNFDTLQSLTSVQLFNATTAGYAPGWTFPGINAPNLIEINLDGPGIVANQEFIDSADFLLSGSSNLKRFTIESLVNAIVEAPSSLVGPIMIFFIKESEDIVLGQTVNTFYSTLGANAANVFDVGLTNTNVSWQTLAIPIEMNGFQQVILSGNDLASFPPIQIMNFFENTTPTSFEIDFRCANNQLNSATIDQILIDFDTMVNPSYTSVVGTLSLGGQTPPAPPGPAGDFARNSLITKGFTISTD